MGRCRQHIGAVSSWMMGGGRAYRNMVHASLRRRFVDTREEEEMPVEDLDSASDTESEAEAAAGRAPSQASREEGDKVAADDGSTISGASDGGRPHLPPVPGKRHLTTPCTCVCAAKRGCNNANNTSTTTTISPNLVLDTGGTTGADHRECCLVCTQPPNLCCSQRGQLAAYTCVQLHSPSTTLQSRRMTPGELCAMMAQRRLSTMTSLPPSTTPPPSGISS